MSDSSSVSFFSKYKTAIVATVGVTVALASAYIVYNNSITHSSSSSSSTSASGASKKKKNKKKKSKSANSGSKTAEYPVDSEKNPSLTKEYVDGLTDEQKESIALSLKEEGNEYFKNKNFEKAIKFYSAALLIKEDPVYYSNRSACYVGLEDYDKVVEDTTKALKLKPDYSKCLLRRSNAYEQLEKYDLAMFDLTALTILGGFNNKSLESILDRVLKKQSYNVVQSNISDQVFTLPSASSISSFFGAFEPELHIDGINEDELKENTGDYYLIHGLRSLNERTNESYDKADTLFNQAVESYKSEKENNDSEDLNRRLGIAYEYRGAFKFLKANALDALEDLQNSIKLYPRAKAYIFSALINADKHEFEKADQDFATGLKLNPNSSELYYHRAQMYYLTNDLEKARENFTKSKELNPSNVYAYIQLACILYREGKFEESEKAFLDAKKKFPTSPEIPNYYGEILADKEDIPGAIKQFEISAKLQDSLPTVSIGVVPLINKATILVKEPSPANIASAVELLEKAIDQDPKSELAKATLAQLKLQSNDITEAIKLFEESSKLARNLEEKIQATSFAEAAKIQLKVKKDPVLSKKIEELLAQFGAADGLTA